MAEKKCPCLIVYDRKLGKRVNGSGSASDRYVIERTAIECVKTAFDGTLRPDASRCITLPSGITGILNPGDDIPSMSDSEFTILFDEPIRRFIEGSRTKASPNLAVFLYQSITFDINNILNQITFKAPDDQYALTEPHSWGYYTSTSARVFYSSYLDATSYSPPSDLVTDPPILVGNSVNVLDLGLFTIGQPLVGATYTPASTASTMQTKHRAPQSIYQVDFAIKPLVTQGNERIEFAIGFAAAPSTYSPTLQFGAFSSNPTHPIIFEGRWDSRKIHTGAGTTAFDQDIRTYYFQTTLADKTFYGSSGITTDTTTLLPQLVFYVTKGVTPGSRVYYMIHYTARVSL